MPRPLTIILLALCAALADAAPSTPVSADSAPAHWVAQGTAALERARRLFPGMPERARNVILFVGDGMGITTITAARILDGQRQGKTGEEHTLAFEELPFLALNKTYSLDQQTAESASTMSSMMTGVKTREGVLSVDASIVVSERRREAVEAARHATLLQLAEGAGLATGVISTARLTHATPAATYAHTSNRDWEVDSLQPRGATVPDIAAQLIDRYGKGGIGDGIEVAMGGGRRNFLPRSRNDPEGATATGHRADRRDLTREWKKKFAGDYVHDRAGFERIDPARTTHLLGLFEHADMEYESDRAEDAAGEPSLAEMTAKAIDILARNPKGFFLMVEAGRIDHAHHAGNAYRALTDTIALSDAVRAALAKVKLEETLVIVTADHSHTFTIGGYPKRGNPILGLVVDRGSDTPARAEDGKPYTTLGYHTGRGMQVGVTADGNDYAPYRTGRREDLRTVDTQDKDFHQEALVPMADEAHGGEDVALFAGGPGAQLFHGVQEQSYVFYVMRAALGL